MLCGLVVVVVVYIYIHTFEHGPFLLLLTYQPTNSLPPHRTPVSKSRKAKAALVRPDLKDPTDPLGHLQRRVFAFVNEYGGGGYEDFGMPGQEPFNVIMYNTTGDEYRCVFVCC